VTCKAKVLHQQNNGDILAPFSWHTSDQQSKGFTSAEVRQHFGPIQLTTHQWPAKREQVYWRHHSGRYVHLRKREERYRFHYVQPTQSELQSVSGSRSNCLADWPWSHKQLHTHTHSPTHPPPPHTHTLTNTHLRPYTKVSSSHTDADWLERHEKMLAHLPTPTHPHRLDHTTAPIY